MSFGISPSCLATGEHAQSHKPFSWMEQVALEAATAAVMDKKKNKVMKKTPSRPLRGHDID